MPKVQIQLSRIEYRVMRIAKTGLKKQSQSFDKLRTGPASLKAIPDKSEV